MLALAAEEEELLRAAILPCRRKSKGRNLHRSMPPKEHLQEHEAGSTPLDAHKHGHGNALLKCRAGHWPRGGSAGGSRAVQPSFQ